MTFRHAHTRKCSRERLHQSNGFSPSRRGRRISKCGFVVHRRFDYVFPCFLAYFSSFLCLFTFSAQGSLSVLVDRDHARTIAHSRLLHQLGPLILRCFLCYACRFPSANFPFGLSVSFTCGKREKLSQSEQRRALLGE